MPQEFRTSSSAEGSSLTRERAFRWLARLAPLLEVRDDRTEPECRAAIALVESLRPEGEGLLDALSARADPQEATLLAAMRDAVPQLESLEEELRRRLARVAPGDPEGRVDLEALRERLAERAARQELGEPVGFERAPARLALSVSPGNLVAAGGMGVFGLGWTAFTTVHALFMIGGMWKVFGPIALALLLFYAMFFLVGFGMLAGAVNAACRESIELQGQELTLVRRLGGWARRRTWTLGRTCRARLGSPLASRRSAMGAAGQARHSVPILVADAEGKEIQFGEQASLPHKEALVERINAYLAALPAP